MDRYGRYTREPLRNKLLLHALAGVGKFRDAGADLSPYRLHDLGQNAGCERRISRWRQMTAVALIIGGRLAADRSKEAVRQSDHLDVARLEFTADRR